MRIPANAQLAISLALIAVGELFIFWRWQPVTDFYFILVWAGYILLADYLVLRRAGSSLLREAPVRLLLMFPLSAVIWWIFEFYNRFLRNWEYLGGEYYQGLGYVLVASLFFSTVLPAVWETADLLLTFFGRRAPVKNSAAGDPEVAGPGRREPGRGRQASPASPRLRLAASTDLQSPTSTRLPAWLPVLGGALSILPVVAPGIAFPLVWVGPFLLLDPLNARAGRPSILVMLLRREWKVPLAFYVGTTVTGFFWEFWNYWAWPKWVYNLPPVVEAFPSLFEMPLPGYLGYGPFGWELFAMWWAAVGAWAWARGGRGG